jgi:hypothetical protein
LLAGHYGAVKTYLDASIAKDAAGQSDATTKLLSNATEIAVFLSTANPYLPKDAVEGSCKRMAATTSPRSSNYRSRTLRARPKPGPE